MSEIAKISDIRDIELDVLELGRSQVRTTNVGAGIDELAESIATVGLLEPILVCPGTEHGQYEIVTGQRRFLAHKQLGRATIKAVILEAPVDEMDSKIISLTENLVRRDLNRKEKIDACTDLYKKYGTVIAVCQATGLPRREVTQYVRYEGLSPKVKDLVDDANVSIDAALRAQRAAEAQGGDADSVEATAVMLATEMEPMTLVQRNKLVKDAESMADGASIEDVVEEAKSPARVTQIILSITAEMRDRLRSYADSEGLTQDDAASTLLSLALDEMAGE